jgi:hypothetical protein
MAYKEIFVAQIGDVDTSARDKLGDVRYVDGKHYRYMKIINDTASVTVAGVAGDPVSYTDGGVANNECTLDVTSADATNPVLAGCLSGTVTGTYNTAYYSWIQVTGLVTVPTAVTSGVIGSGCMTAAGDKTLTITTGVIVPRAMLVTATAANNKCVLLCL